MLEVIKCEDASRVLLPIALTASEASLMYGAVSARVMRLEDILYRNATQSVLSWTKEDMETMLQSARRVQAGLLSVVNALVED